jgi:hypothetical protein
MKSQFEQNSDVSGAAQPTTTEVMVVLTAKPGITRQQIMAIMPSEVRETVKLYLGGKIRQWYSPGGWQRRRLHGRREDRRRGPSAYGSSAVFPGTVDGFRIHTGRAPDAAEGIDGSAGVKAPGEKIMIKPRIIVTGATGQTGRIVVAELLKANPGCGATSTPLPKLPKPRHRFETRSVLPLPDRARSLESS